MTQTMKKNAAALLLLAALGAILYYRAFSVPWYFDDFHNIVKNEDITDLRGALERIFTARGVAFLSFALNYRLGELHLFGYHLVNILIHIGSAFLVYGLLREVYRDSHRWPLAGALIFLAHPIQTQAVTYVVQRMTSMAAFFFLAAVLLYIKARRKEAQGDAFAAPRHLCAYLGALLCVLLAVFTKENTVVLPAALLAADVFVLGRKGIVRLRSLAYLAPFCAIPLLIVYVQMFGEGTTLQAVSKGQVEYFVFPPGGGEYSTPTLDPDNLFWRYLATEFIVFWVYLRLLVAPFGQLLDYCYPLVNGFFNLKSMLGLAGMAAVSAAALACRKRYPLVLFGVLWFFLTLSVESSFFALDPIYEHRLYLPMFGVAIVAIELVFKRFPARWQPWAVAGVVVVLSVLTLQRNALWADPIAFWEDNAARVPHSYRPMDNLATEYFKADRNDEALALYEKALRVHPLGHSMYENMGQLLSDKGELDQAQRSFERAISLSPKPANLYSKLGALYFSKGDFEHGLRYLEKAVELHPTKENLVFNLGSAYYKMGRPAEAERYYRRALELNPRYQKARFSLGYLLLETGRIPEAFAELGRAKEGWDRDANVLYYYALAGFKIGESARAREAMAELEKLDPKAHQKLVAALNAPGKGPLPEGGGR